MKTTLQTSPNTSASLTSTLLSFEHITTISHLKLLHALLLRRLHLLPASASHLLLARLLRFAAVSPAGDLRLAAALFSYHLPRHLSSNPHLAFFYNTLIRGYGKSPNPSLSFSLFNSMRSNAIPPDPYSFTFLLKARSRYPFPFSNPSDIHAQALKFGCLGSKPSHLHVHNALIHLYATFQSPEAAHRVFHEIPAPDVVSWSGILTAYLKGKDVDAARKMFDEMPERDVVSWTAMISGYSRARRPLDALELFRLMPMPPDEVTMVGVVAACAALGDLEVGARVHRYVDEQGFAWMVSLQNALLDMYAKCGCLTMARQVFDGMGTKSLISWNSMISAYATHGDVDSAIGLFNQMVGSDGARPDGVTLLVVLSACAHQGRVEEGQKVFEKMRRGDYSGVEVGIEHYGCMVDLLGRVGLLEEAYQLIQDMPIPSNDAVWGALLGACRIHGDVDMAEQAVKKLMELKPDEGGYYILLSSIYTAAGRTVDAAAVREIMKDKGAKKTPGCSSTSAAILAECSPMPC
ncbi:pentatricopeptide repeat-containing protein At1g74630-like [Typha angustifolia]|uniref:pentatricopeptide repeat-containing protein At1g74630-like n=1 Tax=Typha angustifolia TaxID=59011 RepID=UPI003C2B28CE